MRGRPHDEADQLESDEIKMLRLAATERLFDDILELPEDLPEPQDADDFVDWLEREYPNLGRALIEKYAESRKS